MPENSVTIFKPYPFEIGEKIRIDTGPRSGDWEVIAIDDSKVTLKCPVSHREFKWARFCYLAEQRENEPWPLEH
jgi:hypothetical protein